MKGYDKNKESSYLQYRFFIKKNKSNDIGYFLEIDV